MMDFSIVSKCNSGKLKVVVYDGFFNSHFGKKVRHTPRDRSKRIT